MPNLIEWTNRPAMRIVNTRWNQAVMKQLRLCKLYDKLFSEAEEAQNAQQK